MILARGKGLQSAAIYMNEENGGGEVLVPGDPSAGFGSVALPRKASLVVWSLMHIGSRCEIMSPSTIKNQYIPSVVGGGTSVPESQEIELAVEAVPSLFPLTTPS